jgi:hypothetical protein
MIGLQPKNGDAGAAVEGDVLSMTKPLYSPKPEKGQNRDNHDDQTDDVDDI